MRTSFGENIIHFLRTYSHYAIRKRNAAELHSSQNIFVAQICDIQTIYMAFLFPGHKNDVTTFLSCSVV